jgi:hypothetical protein
MQGSVSGERHRGSHGMARDEHEALWSGLVEGAHLEPHHDIFVSAGLPTIDDEDAGAKLALDARHDVILDREGWRACRALAMSLAEDPYFSIRADFSDLNVELMREVGRVLRSPETHVTAGTLVERLRAYVTASVVVVPLGGIYSSAPDPIRLGDRVVVGHVSREMERAIGDLARSYSSDLSGFRFTDEAWWTEEFLAAEADKSIAEELEEQEADGRSWQPLAVAVAVEGVGGPATYIATVAAEALVGAALALGDPEHLTWVAPPWVLGKATFAGSPRSPMFGDDELLPTAVLVVDSRPGHGIDGDADDEHGRLGDDVDIGELAATSQNRAFLGAAASGCLSAYPSASTQRRFSLACRAFAQVVASPPDLSVLLAAVLLRLLDDDDGVVRRAKDDRPAELLDLVESFLESGGDETQVQDLALARIDAVHLVRERILDAGRHVASSEPS